jgi:RNA polymerase sigma-70 factor (ECF subfamily)
VVFVLSHYEEMSYREIAQVVGCPIGTVASRKFQAVETLRRRLKPWIEGDASR